MAETQNSGRVFEKLPFLGGLIYFGIILGLN